MTEPRLRTRRGLLGAIVAGAALLGAATVPACAPGPTAQPAPVLAQPAPVPARPAPHPGTVIMIIRHGEKPGTPDASPGVDADGHPDKHSLTARGWTRARTLDRLFASPGPARPGLARPAAIYASGGTGGTGTRPRETVAPLAAKLGLRVDTSYSKGDEAALATRVATQAGPTLISWQHQEIPAITAALGPITPTPPARWPDDRFDMVWTFTATNHGWDFAQIPQMLLPGDDPHVFP